MPHTIYWHCNDVTRVVGPSGFIAVPIYYMCTRNHAIIVVLVRGTDGFRKFCVDSYWNKFFDDTADLPDDDTATPGSHADNLLPHWVIQLPNPLPIVSESILQMASHILEEDNSDLAVTNTNNYNKKIHNRQENIILARWSWCESKALNRKQILSHCFWSRTGKIVEGVHTIEYRCKH